MRNRSGFFEFILKIKNVNDANIKNEAEMLPDII
jgi:hypothetical protein